ncbi:MAG: thioredoxin family protein [Gammaproteobacteria bacterium]|nr:thioredoxin family protein [Gammaproteobacteria bacterium]
MSLTPSTMIPLGNIAPNFELPDTVSGKTLALQDIRSDIATVIMFICNHCPYVKHLQDGIIRLARDYTSKGIQFIAISSNDVDAYPEDSPEKMTAMAKQLDFNFPYLFDATQATAKAYDAACTPDFYIFDKDLKCVYRGQFDDSRLGNDIPVTGKYMRAALDALINGQPVDEDQTPSMGCNIKWKA